MPPGETDVLQLWTGHWIASAALPCICNERRVRAIRRRVVRPDTPADMANPVGAIAAPSTTTDRARLLVGPLLRYVGVDSATIWVETSRRACVEVRAGPAVASQMTFQVARPRLRPRRIARPGRRGGHAVRGPVRWRAGLAERSFAVSAQRHPHDRPDRPLRFIFGSCRAPDDGPRPTIRLGSGDDVLGAFARRIDGQEPIDEWPDALLLLGDQVYADETSPETQAFIRAAARRPRGRRTCEVADFEEYTRLYAEAWTDPDVRWLLSTVPSSMIFDDHDVLDDWNTSRSWRDEMRPTAWWQERIIGALMSYWIYQHLGNLSPDELAANELLPAGRRARRRRRDRLRDFARTADREADGGPGILWSLSGATSAASGS